MTRSTANWDRTRYRLRFAGYRLYYLGMILAAINGVLGVGFAFAHLWLSAAFSLFAAATVFLTTATPAVPVTHSSRLSAEHHLTRYRELRTLLTDAMPKGNPLVFPGTDGSTWTVIPKPDRYAFAVLENRTEEPDAPRWSRRLYMGSLWPHFTDYSSAGATRRRYFDRVPAAADHDIDAAIDALHAHLRTTESGVRP